MVKWTQNEKIRERGGIFVKNAKPAAQISSGEHHYSFGYYAENKWLDENRIVLIRGNTPQICTDPATRAEAELVVYDILSDSVTLIAEGIASFTDYAVQGGAVLYVKNSVLFEYDADTCQEKALFSAKNIGSPHVGAHGRYVSVFSCSEESCSFFRVDRETESCELMLDTVFDAPYPYANHGMISPTDKDIIFFAHEGDTRHIPDRLWIYDAKAGKARNIAPQGVTSDGLAADCFGHEAWAHDGRGLYFVKYRESLTTGGICYADINGTPPELLYTGYDYWHVGASSSGKYLTADTRGIGGERSGVVLIDLTSGEELLVDTPSVTFRHPCHPHPQLSPEDTRLAYHYKNEHGNTAVKICTLE